MGAGEAILRSGDVFAEDFRIVETTDKRGAEASYVVEQLSTGKQRLLSLMLPELVADEGRRARFEQEVRIGSRVESQHVIEVVGAGIDATTGIPWLARELLSGEDLASLVKRAGPLSPAIVLEILEQVCDAVGAAHAAGIVHGDLKPDNVFLAELAEANTYLVKVLDFGIAGLVAESRPEHALRGGAVRPQADVWSIGLIAFHLLTGESFELEARERPPTPAGFDGWLARSTDRDAGARFRDARAQIEALRPLLETASSAPADPLELARPSPAEPVAAEPAAAPSPAEPVLAEPAAALSPAEPAAERPATSATAAPGVASSGQKTRRLLVSAVAMAAVILLASVFLLRRTPKVAPPSSTERPAVASVETAAVQATTPVAPASDSDASQATAEADAAGDHAAPDDAATGTAATLPGFDHGQVGGSLNVAECTEGRQLTEDEVRTIVNRNADALKQTCWDKADTQSPSISELVHVVICGTGTVRMVSASSNDAVARCVENMVKGWRFPGGGTLDIPFHFVRQFKVPSGASGPTGPGPFDRGATYGALGSVDVQSCKKGDGGHGHVTITFAPSGRVTNAVVDAPPFAGTAVGNCVSSKFRGAHVPPFLGAPVTLGKSFTLN